jgi:hypothetical protein
MPESSENKDRIKEILEWLHHAYWIREFVLSLGAWGVFMTWVEHRFNFPHEYKWPLVCLLVGSSMYLFVLLRAWWRKRRPAVLPQVQSPAAILAGNANETLSPGIDIEEFFRMAYRSPPLEKESHKNMRILARQKSPDDVEKFYLELIGVGLMAALYDSIWWPMFKSQLLALIEVNRNNGVLPIGKAKDFYDKASEEYTQEYTNDNFGRWFSYLTKNLLVLHHASDMVEITVRGKDFLKYLTHWGREPKDKRL